MILSKKDFIYIVELHNMVILSTVCLKYKNGYKLKHILWKYKKISCYNKKILCKYIQMYD